MAHIIETNHDPLAPVDVDLITLDLVENGLKNARNEMDEVLYRTALSPGIREQHDSFPLIADSKGKMVVGQFGLSVPALLDSFEGTIEEGDVLLTSDPYSCDGAISHANDWLVVVPIYFEGRVAGWSAMFGHMSDVGGKTPSSMPTDARTIFEEGVVIPPFKLYKEGVLNEDPLDVILNQVRQPEWNRADLNGLVAACRTAATRVEEMCERFGVESYAAALDALLDRNFRAMQTLLDTLFTDGETITFSDYICDDGLGYGPYKLTLSLTRAGDKVVLDFTGSAGQAEGPINYFINENLVKMFFGIYLITVADPQIVWNDGFYPLIDVIIPEPSFWKPKYPAALNARNHGIGRLFDLFGGLLGQNNPEMLNAAGFSSSPHFMYSGTYADGERKGEWFQLYSIGFGGIPGRPLGDGPDGHSLWPSFVNIPSEHLEAYYPIRIEAMKTVPDSGGAGIHRGGNAVDVAYLFLQPGTIAIHDDRWLTYPWGVNGGKPGARGRKWIRRADGTEETLPSKIHGFDVNAGDLLHFVTWGGGGWGDPLEREEDVVGLEVGRGLVTGPGALEYGVVCDDVGDVDIAGTRSLREEISARRSAPLPTFDMGPPLEVILDRALEETGLPAPTRPGGSGDPGERTAVGACPDLSDQQAMPTNTGSADSPMTDLVRKYRVEFHSPQLVQPRVRHEPVEGTTRKSNSNREHDWTATGTASTRGVDHVEKSEVRPDELAGFPLTLRAWTPGSSAGRPDLNDAD